MKIWALIDPRDIVTLHYIKLVYVHRFDEPNIFILTNNCIYKLFFFSLSIATKYGPDQCI